MCIEGMSQAKMTYASELASGANLWAKEGQNPWNQSKDRTLLPHVSSLSGERNGGKRTMAPRRLEASGKPRFVNMAAVTRGNTPPSKFRPIVC